MKEAEKEEEVKGKDPKSAAHTRSISIIDIMLQCLVMGSSLPLDRKMAIEQTDCSRR